MGNCCSGHVDDNGIKLDSNPEIMKQFNRKDKLKIVVRLQSVFRGYMSRKKA
jgi:hypothetical protein